MLAFFLILYNVASECAFALLTHRDILTVRNIRSKNAETELIVVPCFFSRWKNNYNSGT